MSLNLNFHFDNDTYRHYMNGFLTVLHCHHYLCLTTQTAIQFKDIGGIEILQKTVVDTIGPILKEYIDSNGIASFKDRIEIGAEYYAVMGLGKMKVALVEHGAKVALLRSHIDQGWITKWGKQDILINFFTVGYLIAMFSAATDLPPDTFHVRELSSIVSGKDTSTFSVVKK